MIKKYSASIEEFIDKLSKQNKKKLIRSKASEHQGVQDITGMEKTQQP